jgi:quinolinate synthase
MKRITLDGILHSLQTMTTEVIVPADIAARARAPINRMLTVKA